MSARESTDTTESNDEEYPKINGTVDSDVFQQFIRAIGAVHSQAPLKVSDAGLEVATNGPSSIAAVRATFPGEAIHGAELTPGEVAIEPNDLIDPLSVRDDLHDVALYHNRDERVLVFDAGAASICHVYPDPDDLLGSHPGDLGPFDTEVRMEATDFKEMVAYAVAVDQSHAYIKYDPDGFELFRFSASTVSEDGVNYDLEGEDLDGHSGTRSMATYPVSFLADFAEAIPDDVVLTLQWSDSHPLQIDYELDCGAEIQFQLAPRAGVTTGN